MPENERKCFKMKIVTKDTPFNNGVYRLVAVSLNANDYKTVKVRPIKRKGVQKKYALIISEDIRGLNGDILNCFDTFEEADREARNILKALEYGQSIYEIR